MLLSLPQLKAIAALTLLSPFVPLLFQGEEWGARTPFLYFTDHENAELGRRVAEGRSKEFSSFGWQGAVPNPQEIHTFERSKLNWSELAEPSHAELFEWYRQLIRLRHEKLNGLSHAAARSTAAARSKAVVRFDAKAEWLRFAHDGVLCVFNFAATAQRVPIPRGEWQLVLRSDMQEAKPARDVPPQATFIFRRRAAQRLVSRLMHRDE